MSAEQAESSAEYPPGLSELLLHLLDRAEDRAADAADLFVGRRRDEVGAQERAQDATPEGELRLAHAVEWVTTFRGVMGKVAAREHVG